MVIFVLDLIGLCRFLVGLARGGWVLGDVLGDFKSPGPF